jgi:hypothetical protein
MARSNKAFVIGGVIIGSAIMTCFASSCSSLLMSGGQSSSKVPNVFGNGNNLVPSELPAAIASLSSACMFYSVVSIVAWIIIDRTKRFDDYVRRQIEEQLFVAMTKVQILQKNVDAEILKRVKAAKNLKEVEAINQKVNDEKLAKGEVIGPTNKIPDFVLLGEVISEEMTKDVALKRLIDGESGSGIPVQMTVNKKTNKAVLKSLRMPRGNFFGKDIDDSSIDAIRKDVLSCNVNTMTHRCGEGYSTVYDTYIHARFFVMNAVLKNRSPNDPNSGRAIGGWEDVGPGTIKEMGRETKKLLQEFDGECFLGNGTWACRKQKVFSLIFGLLNSILFMVGVFTVTSGWAVSISTLLVEGAVVGAEKLVTADSDGDKGALALMEDRLSMFKDHRPLSNWSWGEYESYIFIHTRMNSANEFCPACKGTCNGDRCLEKTKRTTYCTQAWTSDWGTEQQNKLLRYEKLPEAPWNCDDITRRIKLSDSHLGKLGREMKRHKVTSRQGRNTSSRWVPANPRCRNADAKFLKSLKN